MHCSKIPCTDKGMTMSSSTPTLSDTPTSTVCVPKHAETPSKASETNGEVKRIVVTFKDNKFEIARSVDGNWYTPDKMPIPKKRAYSYIRRRVGNKKMYTEAAKRKKQRMATSFGRLRRKHRQELHVRSFRNVNLSSKSGFK